MTTNKLSRKNRPQILAFDLKAIGEADIQEPPFISSKPGVLLKGSVPSGFGDDISPTYSIAAMVRMQAGDDTHANVY
jgi:hypothetical protein